MGYHFTAVWVKGKENYAPDALSRHLVLDPQPHEQLAEQDKNGNHAVSITELRSTTDNTQESLRMQDLRKHANEDETYQQLLQLILDGFPNHRSEMPETCKPYWNARHHLTIDDNLIVHGCRLLIPHKMRRDILSNLHQSHQGSVRTKQRARLTVYWPGIDNDIDNTTSACRECQDRLPSNTKEPLTSKPTPDRPFQEIAADFCHYAGQNYLILVDCLTDWPSIEHMGHNTTTHRLIQVLRQSFCRTAIPDKLWSDRGPQFTAKAFNDFASQWGSLT